jgi:carboxyl-terminal processing protease
MRNRWSIIRLAGPFLLVLIAGLAGGVWLARNVLNRIDPPPGIPSDAASEFELIGEAWETIQGAYVDQEETQPQQLTYGAISGMVQSLGDTGHSRFMDPEMARRHDNVLQGEFEGIGVYVEMRSGRPVVVTPFDDSPAQKAGLEPGDIIVAVDGEGVTDLPLQEVAGRILGPAGTEVTLTIMDPDTGGTRDVSIERAEVELDNVTWQRLPDSGVVHLRIAAFSEGVAQELEEALTEIKEQDVNGLILDLRNNPGGLLNAAVGVTSQFLENGNVLRRINAEGEVTEVPVESGGEALDVPLVVLINSGTASAAEIVTGALQDAGRATAIGQTTFGTGTVLNEFPLSDGSVLLLAVEEWRTPEGRVIWHKGLDPDIQVALPDQARPLFPIQEQDLTAEALQNSEDTQLVRALEALR